jgi:hypothetical protein
MRATVDGAVNIMNYNLPNHLKLSVMKFQSVLLIFAVFVGMSGCEPALKVTSDYDKAANFPAYKTFKMVNSDEAHQSISVLNKERVFNAVRAQMLKRNFVESETPDVIVHTASIFKDKQSVSSYSSSYGYGGYYRPYGWGGSMGVSSYTTYDVQDYKDGSLIIDIIDAKTEKLVWEGVGNKEIDKPAKDPEKAINEAVASIMSSFPPGVDKKKK